MKKIILTLITFSSFAVNIFAQEVTIPDANFKAYLLGNIAINTDGDKLKISVQEANAFTGSIELTSASIASLTGIEAFVNITGLFCFDNQLTSLDVSKNTALTSLNFGNNLMTSVDVSKNTELTILACYSGQLTSLDVSKNSKLMTLYCMFNPNLTCIGALNEQKKRDWEKDVDAIYSEDCSNVLNITNSEINETKVISATYNLQGQAVSHTYQGLVIHTYSDGTHLKVIQE